MATATKSKTATEQLAELQAKRDKQHARVRAAKQLVNEHEAETRSLRAKATSHRIANPDQYEGGDFRPRPDTEAARLAQQIRTRSSEPNPHEAAHFSERDRLAAMDRRISDFRLNHIDELLADAGDGAEIVSSIVRLQHELAGVLDEYVAHGHKVRALAVGLGLPGDHVDADERASGWAKLLREQASNPLIAPALNPRGRAHVDRAERHGS